MILLRVPQKDFFVIEESTHGGNLDIDNQVALSRFEIGAGQRKTRPCSFQFDRDISTPITEIPGVRNAARDQEQNLIYCVKQLQIGQINNCLLDFI